MNEKSKRSEALNVVLLSRGELAEEVVCVTEVTCWDACYVILQSVMDFYDSLLLSEELDYVCFHLRRDGQQRCFAVNIDCCMTSDDVEVCRFTFYSSTVVNNEGMHLPSVLNQSYTFQLLNEVKQAELSPGER